MKGQGSELFKRGWKLWLVALSPFILGIVLAVVNAGHKSARGSRRGWSGDVDLADRTAVHLWRLQSDRMALVDFRHPLWRSLV